MIFCLGFVSKKLGEKTLFDSLFTCTFARARATLRKRDEKQKTEITDRALFPFLGRDSIPFLCSTSGASTLERSCVG